MGLGSVRTPGLSTGAPGWVRLGSQCLTFQRCGLHGGRAAGGGEEAPGPPSALGLLACAASDAAPGPASAGVPGGGDGCVSRAPERREPSRPGEGFRKPALPGPGALAVPSEDAPGLVPGPLRGLAGRGPSESPGALCPEPGWSYGRLHSRWAGEWGVHRAAGVPSRPSLTAFTLAESPPSVPMWGPH